MATINKQILFIVLDSQLNLKKKYIIKENNSVFIY